MHKITKNHSQLLKPSRLFTSGKEQQTWGEFCQAHISCKTTLCWLCKLGLELVVALLN